MLKLSVVVPTYRRPLDLARCLSALQQQHCPADEVIVIVRDTDTATWDWVSEDGQLLDDARAVVDKLQWFGRMIGNHHLGVGAAREVDILKGVNMSWRRSAISQLRFDERLQGSGAQVHFEIAFSLAVRRAGWSIIYNPLVAVAHYPASRSSADPRLSQNMRSQFNAVAMTQSVHNEMLGILEHLPWLNRVVFLLWAVAIGTRIAPGLLQCWRFWPQEGSLAGAKWWASFQGRWQGWQTWQHTRLAKFGKECR